MLSDIDVLLIVLPNDSYLSPLRNVPMSLEKSSKVVRASGRANSMVRRKISINFVTLLSSAKIQYPSWIPLLDTYSYHGR